MIVKGDWLCLRGSVYVIVFKRGVQAAKGAVRFRWSV